MKKLSLNKEVIATLDQTKIIGGLPYTYTVKAIGDDSNMLAGTCGGGGGGTIVSDDCGTYTTKTTPGWGHECW